MSEPVLIAVDDDPDALKDVERELRDRYGRHYRVTPLASSGAALTLLEDLAEGGQEVALILAGQWLSGMTGTDLLDRAHRLHPHAKRGLLVDWGDWGDRPTGDAIFAAIAHGSIDHYVLRPAAPPDELFHQAISGLLLEWAEARRNFPFTVQVVGETWSGRAYQLRETLGRCAIPHSFLLANSGAGRALVNAAGPQASLPLVVFPNGQMLQNPSNADLASAAGWTVAPEGMNFDLVIVGSGPAGLSAAVYGASEGFSTLVIDEGGIGGQSTSSSLIRNYLGFPRGISGRSLAQRAYEQAWLFGVQFAFMQEVTELREEDGGAALHLADFGWVGARAVLLATGATYRRLGVAALEDLSGAGVFYGGPVSEASGLAGQEVYVLGGANSAGQAALHLARYARRVTIVVRAGSLEAGMSHYLVRQIEATPNVEVRVHTEVVDGGGDGRLERLVLRDHDGEQETVRADGLFILIGATPRADWLPDQVQRDHRGFVLTGTDLGSSDGSDDDWPLERRPLLLETSMPRVFAAGDIRHGSAKRVASAVGEGSVAVQLLHQLFADDRMHPRGRPTAPPVAS